MDLMEARRRLLMNTLQQLPENYLEWVQIALNQCLNPSSGLVKDENGMAYTVDFIPVNTGDVFEYTYTTQTNNRTRQIYGYDANQQPVERLASRGWSTLGETYTITATIPSTVKYIRASYYNGDTNKSLIKI